MILCDTFPMRVCVIIMKEKIYLKKNYEKIITLYLFV